MRTSSNYMTCYNLFQLIQFTRFFFFFNTVFFHFISFVWFFALILKAFILQASILSWNKRLFSNSRKINEVDCTRGVFTDWEEKIEFFVRVSFQQKYIFRICNEYNVFIRLTTQFIRKPVCRPLFICVHMLWKCVECVNLFHVAQTKLTTATTTTIAHK